MSYVKVKPYYDDGVPESPYKVSKTIWVRFQREGIHRYPEAATDPKLADVAFLAHPHRHIFHFEVGVSVVGDNRDIEFIQFKRWLESMFDQKILNLEYRSCEMIGNEILDKVFAQYPTVTFAYAKISEDGENGATITRRKK